MDASLIDLNNFDTKDWVKGKKYGIQTLMKSQDGRVLGQITVEYLGNNQVKILPDVYNFEYHPKGSIFRNVATAIGLWKAGNGTEYQINFKGVNTIKRIAIQYDKGPKF